MDKLSASTKTLQLDWLRALRANPMIALGFLLICILLIYLMVSNLSIFWGSSAEKSENLRNSILGGLAGFAATAFGAFGAFPIRHLSQKVEDSMLGFAAGMMLAASCFSLILPGLIAAASITGHRAVGAFIIVLGLGLGSWLMLGLDRFIPHAHIHAGSFGPGHQRISRVWLFVMAIVLHNLPEGMAIGVSFSQGDLTVGLPLTIAIAIQDIPEGLAISMSLRAAGLSSWVAVGIAVASGIMEPLGAILGIGMTGGFSLAYPLGLSLAAGAMIFVVSHEVIPETHRNGHQTLATLGLMAGFAVMTFLDNVFVVG